MENPHKNEGDQNNPFNIHKNPRNTFAIKNNQVMSLYQWQKYDHDIELIVLLELNLLTNNPKKLIARLSAFKSKTTPLTPKLKNNQGSKNVQRLIIITKMTHRKSRDEKVLSLQQNVLLYIK